MAERRISRILLDIYRLRVELERAVNGEGQCLLHPEVQEKSQRLDRLLVEYYHRLRKKGRETD